MYCLFNCFSSYFDEKTVSIASSNVRLSNRDYYESFEFFKRIHYNELPFSNNYFQLEIMMTFIQENFTQKNSLFANASNNNEISKDKADIAFSTFVNFESLYLRIMEMYPVYIKEYFQKCSLVIDRVDSILVVELTNGTILPRSLKTNGE